MTGRMRQIAKSLIIRSGGLGLYHRAKHREVLTVLMFHRVLPESLITVYGADPEYTISTDLLEQVIKFVSDHYTIVSLDDVLQSRQKKKALPSYPLLVTFDDGWEDNATFASEILAKANVPWTLFAATDAISSGPQWWQEDLLAILRADNSAFDKLKTKALLAAGSSRLELPSDPSLAALLLYSRLAPAERDGLIASQSGHAREAAIRDMVDWETLRALQKRGVHIAGHGASHLPLTMIDNPATDLQRAQRELQRHLGDGACAAMSFPHGRYNSDVVKEARSIGVELMFTSDPVLNKCPAGWLQSDLVGRVSVSTDAIAANGKLQVERVMPWLMLRATN